MQSNKIFLVQIFFFITLIHACIQPIRNPASLNANKDQNQSFNQKITLTIFPNGGNSAGFGYDIYINEVLFIHQPHIPAIQGVKAFCSKIDAEKVGNLVIKKIQNGNNPPKVSILELDSLQIRR